jgi:hypothetical protein
MEATLLLLTALLLAPLAVLHADDDLKKKPDEALMLRDLKFEYRINPVGIDVANPRLSWKIESVERGVIQSA